MAKYLGPKTVQGNEKTLNGEEVYQFKILARKAAKKYGLDPEIFLAQITLESGWDKDAKGRGIHIDGDPENDDPENITHAEGLGQVVAYWHPDLKDTYDPAENLNYAAKLMAAHIERHRRKKSPTGPLTGPISREVWVEALADYNTGPNSDETTFPPRSDGIERYAEVILGRVEAGQTPFTTDDFKQLYQGKTTDQIDETLAVLKSLSVKDPWDLTTEERQTLADFGLSQIPSSEGLERIGQALGPGVARRQGRNAEVIAATSALLEAATTAYAPIQASDSTKQQHNALVGVAGEAKPPGGDDEGQPPGVMKPEPVQRPIPVSPFTERVRATKERLEGYRREGDEARNSAINTYIERLTRIQERIDAGQTEAQINADGKVVIPRIEDALLAIDQEIVASKIIPQEYDAGEIQARFDAELVKGLATVGRMSLDERQANQSVVVAHVESAIQTALSTVRALEGGAEFTPKTASVFRHVAPYVNPANSEAMYKRIQAQLGLAEGTTGDELTNIIEGLTNKIRDAKDPMTREMAIRTFGYAVDVYKELIKDGGELPADWAQQEAEMLAGFAELSPDQAQTRADQIIKNRMDLRKMEIEKEETQFTRAQGLEALEEGRTRYAREEQIDVRENIRNMQQRQQEQTTGIHRAVAASQQALASEYLGHAPKFGPVTPGAKIGGANIYEQLAESRGIVDPQYLGYGSAVPSVPQASDMQAFHEALASARAKLAYGSEAEVLAETGQYGLPTYTPTPGVSTPETVV